MGNQNAKVGVRKDSRGNFVLPEEETQSRTDWTAGVPSPPGQPIVELSTHRVDSGDEDSEANAPTDEINISWDVPKDDGGYPITGYRVEMLDIQSGCWIELTFLEGYEPRCTLSNILYGIMYRFRVTAINDAGASTPGDPSDPVVVDVPGVQIAPYFVQHLGDTIALEHEKIEFRVRVLGTPKPSVQWFKDDIEIFSCDRIELREEEEGGAVILKSAKLSDTGTVKCVATNLLGKAVSTAQLSIEAAPRLELPENYVDGLVFHQDEVIRLKIPLVAKPAPRVVWFFEDEPISGGSGDLQVETSDNFSVLRIQNAKRWHCGEFRVYAENENGEDACSVLVTVTAPPSPPGKPEVIDISETRCTLRWEPSADDGGAEVKHYVVEYYRDAWNVWLKAKTAKATQALIEDLIPGSRYTFRLRAENDFGLSEASEESTPFDVSGLAVVERQSMAFSQSQEWPSQHSISQEEPINPTSQAVSALEQSRGLWLSDEQEESILDRFLRVQQFKDDKGTSMESDSLPSVAPIEDNLSDFSSSADFRPASEDIPMTEDDESSLPELRPVTISPDDSIFSPLETASVDSLSNLIPPEKRDAMEKFEQKLKDMIQEAKEMAKEDNERTEERSQDPLPPQQQHQPRSKKSPSVQSTTESVISVIERPDLTQQLPKISVTSDDGVTSGSPQVQSATPKQNQIFQFPEGEAGPSWQSPSRPPRSESRERASPELSPSRPSRHRHPNKPFEADLEEQLDFMKPSGYQQNQSNPSKAAALDNENVFSTDKKLPLQDLRGLIDDRQEAIERMKTQLRHQEVPGQPLDEHKDRPEMAQRYDELIRRNSRERSQPKLEQSPEEELSPIFPKRREVMMATNGTVTRARPLSLTRRSMSGERPMEIPMMKNTPSPHQPVQQRIKQPAVVEAATKKQQPDSTFQPKPIEISIDPTLPPTNIAADTTDSSSFKLSLPRNLPHWFLITYAYSFVLVAILLLANMLPDGGKLYIHFTAFWSLVVYFLLDDDDEVRFGGNNDPLETVMEGLYKH